MANKSNIVIPKSLKHKAHAELDFRLFVVFLDYGDK